MHIESGTFGHLLVRTNDTHIDSGTSGYLVFRADDNHIGRGTIEYYWSKSMVYIVQIFHKTRLTCLTNKLFVIWLFMSLIASMCFMITNEIGKADM